MKQTEVITCGEKKERKTYSQCPLDKDNEHPTLGQVGGEIDLLLSEHQPDYEELDIYDLVQLGGGENFPNFSQEFETLATLNVSPAENVTSLLPEPTVSNADTVAQIHQDLNHLQPFSLNEKPDMDFLDHDNCPNSSSGWQSEESSDVLLMLMQPSPSAVDVTAWDAAAARAGDLSPIIVKEKSSASVASSMMTSADVSELKIVTSEGNKTAAVLSGTTMLDQGSTMKQNQAHGPGTTGERTSRSNMRKKSRAVQDAPSNAQAGPSARCYVCNEQADRYRCYGGRVCLSCRSFFRRAVRSKYYRIFSCSNDSRCDLETKTRRRCQACRFKKCIEGGMKVENVLSEEERNRRFNKLTKKGVLAASPEEITTSSTTLGLAGDWARFPSTILPRDNITKITRAVREVCIESKTTFLLSNSDFLKEYTMLAYFGGRISKAAFRKYCQMQHQFLWHLHIKQQEIAGLELSLDDRREMCKDNCGLLTCIIMASNLVEKESFWERYFDGLVRAGHLPGVSDLTLKLAAVALSARRATWEYHQFFPSEWAGGDMNAELRHMVIMRRINGWPRDSGRDPLDMSQLYLLYGVALLTPSTKVVLKQAHRVEKLRDWLTHQLGRYLAGRYGADEGRNRLVEGMRTISLAREALEIQERVGMV